MTFDDWNHCKSGGGFEMKPELGVCENGANLPNDWINLCYEKHYDVSVL
jgi:hypothetical protein